MPLVMFEKEPSSPWETVFSNGFRPLFLCVGGAAVVAIGLWVALLSGLWLGGTLAMSPSAWHGHEMLFGFVGAAMGGFLLAAVAKWTDRLPVSGWPLGILVVCWLLGRLAVGFSNTLPYAFVVMLDLSYSILLALLVGREVVAAGNRRNYKVIVLLALFGLFNAVFHAGVMAQESDWQALAMRGVMMQICIMIALIGGRITPAFTRNYLVQRDGAERPLPVLFNTLDTFISVLLGLAAIAWIAMPDTLLTGCLLIAAGLGQWVRVSRWQGLSILEEPLLWILHLGFVWLGAGLILLGAASIGWVALSAGQHALAMGAMAGMILGVASRAALGHTQRALKAGRLMQLAFVLISLAALCRVVASLLMGTAYLHLIYTAAGLWLLAFVLFCIRYVPILLLPAPSWRYPGA